MLTALGANPPGLWTEKRVLGQEADWRPIDLPEAEFEPGRFRLQSESAREKTTVLGETVDALAEKKFVIAIGGAEFRGADGVAGAGEAREGFGCGSGIRVIAVRCHVEIRRARGERGGDRQESESFFPPARTPTATPHRSNFTCKIYSAGSTMR